MFVCHAVRRLPVLLPVVFALALAGCSDKDDNPVGAGDADLGDAMDADTFGQQAMSTLDFVNGMVDDVEQIADGDLSGVDDGLGLPASGLRSDEPQWVPAQNAYVLDVEGTESEDGSTASYDVYLWIQFRDQAGLPQQDPDSTTSAVEMRVDYFFDIHAAGDGTTLDMALDYDFDMIVGGMPAGPFTVDADGDMDVTMAFSDGRDNVRMAMDMAWMMNLSVPANNGCPSGTALVQFEDWTFSADYDGQGGYDWSVRERGSVEANGHENLVCSLPAS